MGGVETHHTVHQAASTDDDETAIKAIVYSYYKAVNDSRWDDVVAYFHPDATLHIPGQEPKVGADEIRRFYEAHGRHAVKHHDDVPLLMVDGNRVLTLVDHHGVGRGGEPIHFWTTGVVTIDNGRFRQYRVIFDTMELPQWMRERKGTSRSVDASAEVPAPAQ
jgi:ketosteroid isomerase-like protein